MLSQLDEWRDSKEARVGAECLLNLWEKSRETHPYMFYMGTDFRKMKAPFIWYDILDRSIEGKYTPESEWRAWKGWDFGQKKQPSRWLTFIVLRILRRVESS